MNEKEKEPSRRPFGEDIWPLPFKSGSLPARLETGAESPVWSLKALPPTASICCSLITAVTDGANVPKYGIGELSP